MILRKRTSSGSFVKEYSHCPLNALTIDGMPQNRKGLKLLGIYSSNLFRLDGRVSDASLAVRASRCTHTNNILGGRAVVSALK